MNGMRSKSKQITFWVGGVSLITFVLMIASCGTKESLESSPDKQVAKTVNVRGAIEAERPGDEPKEASSPRQVPPNSVNRKGEPGCTMESVKKTVQTRKKEVTKCYIDALVKEPGLAGRIAINLGIQPGGKLVQRSVFESDLPESVAACILKNLRGLEFPGVFEKPCGIVYPFVFSSNSGQKTSRP